jgi:acetolactate synthase-1/2/3 large subunit
MQWPDRGPWHKLIRNMKHARRKRLRETHESNRSPINPYQAVSVIVENIDERTIVIGDGAESYHWLNEVIHQRLGGSYITHGFLGAVGFGLGLAIGAQVAHPDRPVLCVAGDGAIGFTIAEFDTMVRHRLPIVVVIMNNASWGASQRFQEMVSGPERVIGTRLGGARYHEVAAAFGCHAAAITDLTALGPAIQAAFACGRPACIDVTIDFGPTPPEIELLMSR